MAWRCLGLNQQCGTGLDGVRVSKPEVGNGAQEPICGVFVSAGKIANLREQLPGEDGKTDACYYATPVFDF